MTAAGGCNRRMDSGITISVVIPVLDDRAALAEVLSQLGSSSSSADEIIVVQSIMLLGGPVQVGQGAGEPDVKLATRRAFL